MAYTKSPQEYIMLIDVHDMEWGDTIFSECLDSRHRSRSSPDKPSDILDCQDNIERCCISIPFKHDHEQII